MSDPHLNRQQRLAPLRLALVKVIADYPEPITPTELVALLVELASSFATRAQTFPRS